MCSFCSHLEDLENIARASGDEAKAKHLHLASDLLLPLIKGYNSERVYEILAVVVL